MTVKLVEPTKESDTDPPLRSKVWKGALLISVAFWTAVAYVWFF